MPHVYAFRSIDEIIEEYYKYVIPYLTKDYYTAMNKEYIKPILNEINWSRVLENLLNPSKVKKQGGRPKKNKKKEQVKILKCKKVVQLGVKFILNWGTIE